MIHKKNEEVYLNSNEVMEMLRISPSTLRRLIKSGKIKRVKLSPRKNLYSKEDIISYIESKKEENNDL